MHNSIATPEGRRLCLRFTFFVLSLALVACTRAPAPRAQPRAPQVTEHRDLLQVAVKLAIGARCDGVGREGCLDGVCLSVGPERERRVCSKPCVGQDAASCPQGFACTQIYPSNDAAWFCAPVVATTEGEP